MTNLPLAWVSAIADSSVKGWMRCIDNLDYLDVLDVLEKKNDEYIIKYTNNYKKKKYEENFQVCAYGSSCHLC